MRIKPSEIRFAWKAIAIALCLACLSPASAANPSDCQSHDVDQTIRACTLIIQHGRESQSDVAAAYATRALAHWHKGAYAQAAADSHQAIRHEGEFALAYIMRGIHLVETGDHQAAIADFGHSLAIEPWPVAYYNRGTAYLALADYVRAVTDFDNALRIDASFAPAYLNRALARLHLGEVDMARADAQSGVSILTQSKLAKAIQARIIEARDYAILETPPLAGSSLSYFPASKALPNGAFDPVLRRIETQPPVLKQPRVASVAVAPGRRTRATGRSRFPTSPRAHHNEDASVAKANRDELMARFRFSSDH
jgi:tetratricopeptide (TPR) repeat protein